VFVQSATNIFVVCLAVSDLTLCLFSLPVQLHYQLTDNWYFGSALCRVIFAAFAVPMYLSTCTVMLIAVDRSTYSTSSLHFIVSCHLPQHSYSFFPHCTNTSPHDALVMNRLQIVHTLLTYLHLLQAKIYQPVVLLSFTHC